MAGVTAGSRGGIAVAAAGLLLLVAAGIAAEVAEAWVRRYNGPGSSWDYSNAVAVDDAGNVYVTGYSMGSEFDYDYVTIKYNSAGVGQWVRRYNGPGNGTDKVAAIVVDAAGNCYVTGESWGPGTGIDYATVKYDAAGNEKWARRYDGPGNATDHVHAVAVDDAGNVYVTGYSHGVNACRYATVKYDSSGVERWVRLYDGPAHSWDRAYGIALDRDGNVYVTGESHCGGDAGYDYATVKYDSDGAEQWVARYSGPANSHSSPAAIVLDRDGNVCITGSGVGSGTGYDYVTVKYDGRTGGELWLRRYDGPANRLDHATGIAVDGAGNVLVTGYSKGSGTGDDYATVKYDAAGREQWARRYNDPVDSTDQAFAIAVDRTGCVYVTGLSRDSCTGEDYVTIKYDAAGREQWVVRYSGAQDGSDGARAIAVDRNGDVIVTGESRGSGTGFFDYATVKYVQRGDVGATAVSAPVGTVSLGSAVLPKVTVENFGLVTATFRVEVVIEDSGGTAVFREGQQVDALDPGESRDLAFATRSWTAAPAGRYTVTAATRLVGDMNTDNDALTDSVFVRAKRTGCCIFDFPLLRR